MARQSTLSLADLGENRFLARLLRSAPSRPDVRTGPGDDCAVVRGTKNDLLLKTDAVVEGAHYLPGEDPRRVGWKALCRVLSDIAAMGGQPRHALVTILTPPDRSAAYWEQVYRGLGKAARKFGVSLAGGELTQSSVAGLSVALVGEIPAGRAVLRSGGRPGDRLYVTGTLGGSLTGKHLDFLPRLAEGGWLAEHRYARAMMDLSDGMGSDLPRLAEASECGYELDLHRLPLSRNCSFPEALRDGEDYELLFAVSPRRANQLEKQWKQRFPRLRLTAIGHLKPPQFPSLPLSQGFDHFRS